MNFVDLGIVMLIGLSAILALVRGLVSEVLSVGSWVGAVFVTLYATPYLRPYMRAHVEPEMLADGMAIAGVFILSLVVFSIVTHEVSKSVRSSALSALDRSLGLLFGVARGALLVCLASMVVSWLMPKVEDQPQWLRDAKIRPLAENGAAWLQALLPANIRDQAAAQSEAAAAQIRQTYQDADALRRMTTARPEVAPPAAPPAAAAASGSAASTGGGQPARPGPAVGDGTVYNKKEQRELDRLFKNAN